VLTLVDQNSRLEHDPLSDWQPVKIPQNACAHGLMTVAVTKIIQDLSHGDTHESNRY